MQDLITKRSRTIKRVAQLANKSDPNSYNASDAQFMAWGSKEEPPKGVKRLEDVELVNNSDGRQFIVGLREQNGEWVPTKYEILPAR